MAKLKFSALLTEASGSVGSVTLSRWKGRPYARSRVTPSNPKTVNQVAVRHALSACVALWRSLASGIALAWKEAGASRSISPYNAFCSVNAAAERAGYADVYTPVNKLVVPIDSAAAAAGASAGYLAITWTAGLALATDEVHVAVRHAGEDAWEVVTDTAALVSGDGYVVTGLTPGVTYRVAVVNHNASHGYALGRVVSGAAHA